ncbi:MAG TPA: GNAT family N-acetyltransferase [Steroidobacteraceae bacterium]|nr:GNAT family N-acetyltransferase [Steroidobacteraceae bacterium]
MIREATPDDIDQIAVLGERELLESHYGNFLALNRKAMKALALMLIEEPHGLLLVDEFYGELAGMLGVVATIHPYSGESILSQWFWYCAPEARGGGVKLFLAAEKWAQENGVIHSVMGAPNERVAKFYMRMGYVPLETHFIKTL